MNIINFYIHTNIFFFSNVFLGRVLTAVGGQCPISKQGNPNGEATMFQESWTHGKTGACGFAKPTTSHAEGFFTAVGGPDWEDGLGCGTCAQLEYQGNTVTVNVVDRCWGCSKGWFDLGGPAWHALTGGAPPGHIHGVKSTWVTCPGELARGNIQVYVKPGSDPWDARFQPTQHVRPVKGMAVSGGSGWQDLRKCENYMFCKPAGITLQGQFQLRIISDTGNIDVSVPRVQGDTYIDMGANNGGSCSASGGGAGSGPSGSATTTSRPEPPATTQAWTSASVVDCSVKDGLFPDPTNCRGFIKCAQGEPYPQECGGGLYFDPVTYNCNWPTATNCNGRPV